MKSKTLFYFFAILALTSCQSNYKTEGNGIIVKNGKEQVRLEVISDKIIRVSTTQDSKFSETKSLIIVPQTSNPKYKIDESDTTITISTSELYAIINKQTLEVEFKDLDGQPILQENGDGREFTSIEVEGTKGYSLRQMWKSPDDEAFYGLGQHQADEFNYKGKNEELFQYNTKVSIPFIVSNKNYGVLWDNYSLTRFGNKSDYLQINETFKVYNKDGNEGGLSSHWVNGENILDRTEPILYFENLKANRELLPKGFPLYGSNVTFDGFLEPTENGEFKFILYYAGYIKIFINDKQLFPERWRTAWNPNSYKFAYQMEANTKYKIHIEWVPDGGESYCGLRAFRPVSDDIQNSLSFWSEMGDMIDYYFIKGNNLDDVISGYRTLTGKSQIMPRWAMGFWQSRERYKTAEELLSTLKEFRSREIPIDNIVQDWSYWPEDAWGSHEFDKNRFPDPKAMVDSIHAMNAHVMISVWPKFYCSTEHYKEFDQNGWMYQQAVKDSIRDWIGEGYLGSFYDAYSDGARKLFWNQMKEHLYGLGFDAWWMDASEPNVRDCTDLEYRKALCGPTALGPSTKYFNAYALMNAEAIYDGQRSVDNNKRVFLLTRSGFAGEQRYSTATWSGDIATRWEDLKAQISAGLNFSISGVPYWTMDIGGFCVEKRYELAQNIFDQTGKENADLKEWRELNTRWYQFGAFCPLYRSHGQFPYREIWNIAPNNHIAYKSILYYTKLRYNLMPYIYSLAGMTYFNDYTIMRPLIMDFTKDCNVNNISDQYMFGTAFMVCPIYKYEARARNVYFPNSTGWYDFYTGKFIRGGQTIEVDAPYDHIPLFVREGAIIPFGPDMQYADEKATDNISILVYTGSNGHFSLYEDENTNYNYEQGKFSTIEFNYDEESKSLVIENRQGDFDNMLKDRTFNIIFINKDNTRPFDKNEIGQQVKYNGEKIIVKYEK